MKKILGLDLGITSIGSALVDFDENKMENINILHSNIRIFNAPIKDKDKTSLQKIRGEIRRERNGFENYNTRRKKIIDFIIKKELIFIQDVKQVSVNLPKSKRKKLFANKVSKFLFETEKNSNDILSLRYKALYENLTNIEFARLLYSMNNHRGVSYEDSRSSKNISEEKLTKLKSKNINDYEDGSSDKLLYGLLNFKESFDTQKYKTVGEFLYLEHKDKFRNTQKKNSKDKKDKKSDFLFVIPRKNIVDELNFIFDTQISLGNNIIDEDFKNKYIEAFEWEEISPSYKDLVAPCLIKYEAKSSSRYKVEAQLYIYLEKLYNLSYKAKEDKHYVNLNIDELLVLINCLETKTITYKQIKDAMEKHLKKEKVLFKGISDYSKTFIDFKEFKEIVKALSLDLNILTLFKNSNDKNLYNNVIEILAYTPKALDKENKLKELGIENQEIHDALLEIKIKGNLSYCEEVLEQICNGMLSGLIPHYAKEIVENANPKKRINRTHYLPPVNETDLPIKNNHVVVRALSQMRLVINDTLKHYRKVYNNPNWFFDKVIIETGRDFLSEKQVKEHNAIVSENEKANKEAIVFCEKYGKLYPSKEEILKAKLYIQQKGLELYPKFFDSNVAQYSLIEAERLFEEGYCEIDHTLPISRSIDDSFNNKTLVLAKTNQDKDNKTPYEFLSKELFEIMEESLKSKIKVLGFKKVNNLLNKTFKELDGFSSRDLNDTRIITKYAGLYINNYLAFPNDENTKRRVFASNGRTTALLRKSWGIGSKNRNNHLHHGEDAILIALCDNALIKHISTYYGIQTQLENFNFNKESFNILFKNNTSIRDYIIKKLKEDNIDIENINNCNISKKDISSKIFRIIAEKNLPREDFLDNFRKAISDSIVTHKEKLKTNGQIHENTISKKNNKTKDDMVFVRGGTAVNGGFIRYDVFKNNKNKFEFVKITPKHCGLLLNELPKPKDLDSLFLFSIYPKTYLNLVYEENKISEETKGLFRKIDGSLYLDSVKNTENEIYKYKLKRLKLSYLLSNDLEPFSKDEIKKITPLLKFDDFEKKAVLKTSIDSIRETLKKIENYFIINYPDYKILFVFNKTSCKETYLIKENLLSENIILNQIEELDEIKTIVFNIEEEKLISPYFVLAPTKIKSIKKIKTDTFGNESIILQEKREPLLNHISKVKR